MTWLTTWPDQGVPRYAEHASEAEAEAHAAEVARTGGAAGKLVTVFEADICPALAEAGAGATRGADVGPSATETLQGAVNDTAVILEGTA